MWQKTFLYVRFELYNNSCKVSHLNLSNIPFKWLLNAIQKICAYVNLKEIKELVLNQVFKKKKKKKNFNHQTKVSVCVIKDNSINLLEFVFDLNFDEIFFPENPNKIVQNKIKVF